MKKKTLTEALVLEDFQKAVVFLTLLKIKKNFNNASEYANSKHNDKAKYLHIDSKILKRFSTFDNKRLFNKFLQKSDNLFDFHKHVALKYASGKKFKINSWFELKFSIDELDKYLKSDLYMSLKSELYSKRVHKILDNLFNSKKKEESNTTKSEEKKEDNMTKAEEKAILKGIAPKQQLHPDNDIPDVPPEPAHVKPPVDDIPDKEPTYPSKILYKLAEFVKKCYINPNTASRLATMYGESQTFKSPKVQCDLVAALQSNVKQRLFILKAAHKELLGKLNKKDLDWLVSNINRTEKEVNTIN